MPEVTLVPIDPDGRYILFVQDLPMNRMEELIDVLRQFSETKGQMAVINFPSGVTWKFVNAKELHEAIISQSEKITEKPDLTA